MGELLRVVALSLSLSLSRFFRNWARRMNAYEVQLLRHEHLTGFFPPPRPTEKISEATALEFSIGFGPSLSLSLCDSVPAPALCKWP